MRCHILISPCFVLQSETSEVAKETHTQNIQNSLQSSGCSRAPGRFLPQPGGLVFSERAQCGTGHLCLPVERLHQPGMLSLPSLPALLFCEFHLCWFSPVCSGDPPVWSVCWRRFCDVCGLVGEGKFLDFPRFYRVTENNTTLHHTKALSICG